MINRILICLILCVSVSAARGQKSKEKSLTADQLYSLQHQIYRKAIACYDFSTAATALHTMLAIQPEHREWKDTLASVYYTQGNWLSAILVSEEILNDSAGNLFAREILAESQTQYGLTAASLSSFEKLFQQEARPMWLYRVICLRYELKRQQECFAGIQTLLSLEGVGTETIRISYEDGSMQAVPLAAAALNVGGMLLKEAGRTAEAREIFKQSLNMMPEFVLAANNLASLPAE